MDRVKRSSPGRRPAGTKGEAGHEAKPTPETESYADREARDREIIRVDFADDRIGITAALRRAFAEAATDRSTHDFEQLLSELN